MWLLLAPALPDCIEYFRKNCDAVPFNWPGRHQTLPLLCYSTPLPNPFINILLICLFPAAYHPRSSEKSCDRIRAPLFGSTRHSSRSTWHFKGHEQTDLNTYLLAEAEVMRRRPPPARLIRIVAVVVVVVDIHYCSSSYYCDHYWFASPGRHASPAASLAFDELLLVRLTVMRQPLPMPTLPTRLKHMSSSGSKHSRDWRQFTTFGQHGLHEPHMQSLCRRWVLELQKARV